MFSSLLFSLLSASVLSAPDTAFTPPPAAVPAAVAADAGPASQELASTTYTVWYKAPGGRWHGTSGCSAGVANDLVRSYQRKGWSAYSEPD